MSEVKVDEYIVSFGRAKEALSIAIDQADALGRNGALSKQQQADAIALASDLGAQKVLLIDAHNRFMAKFFLPNPPSQATVDEAIAKMRELAQVVANNILAEGKLEAVIGIISAINELAEPAAPAPAPAAAAAGGPAGVAIAPAAVAAKAPSGPELVMAATTTHWLRQMRKRQ
jgi:hypothetical protein